MANQNDRCNEALKEFKSKYPTISSADMQTFILAFKAGEDSMLNEVKRSIIPNTVRVHWKISHFESDLGTGLQVWQYVNGGGDGGFSCLVKDYSSAVARQCGVGAFALCLSNQIYEYVKANKL